MKTNKALLLVLLCIMSLTAACGPRNQTAPAKESDGLTIYTTVYPLYDFTKTIVGNRGHVETLIPAGADPHDFELSLKQTAKLYEADLFIYLGESMEPWAEKLAGELEGKGVAVIEAGKGLVKNDDPHIWLDPILAKEISARICERLVSIDREQEGTFKENLAKLMDDFDQLDEDFKALAQKAVHKDLVVSHAFLGYVADRYGFNQIAITGLSPQDDPSPKKMGELVEFCKANGIKYIFAEQGEVQKLASTLAEEVGAEILTLNPLGSLRQEDMDAGQDYFSIMRANLKLLNQALAGE